MENSLDLTEALDELLQDLYGQYNIKEAEKSLNVILNIINNNDIDIFNSNNNIEMIINMLDYFQIPFITDKNLNKFLEYYNIQVIENNGNIESYEFDNRISNIVKNLSKMQSIERINGFIVLYKYMLEHLKFLKKSDSLSVLRVKNVIKRIDNNILDLENISDVEDINVLDYYLTLKTIQFVLLQVMDGKYK